nr:unnamed protein product [Callosobruchus chinensis]
MALRSGSRQKKV